MRSNLFIPLALGLLISALAACKDDEGGSPQDVGTDRGTDDVVTDVADVTDTATDLVVPDRGDDTGDCGDLTFEGECVGETVRWCDGGEVNEIDCSTWGTCELITEEFGYWCVGTVGSECPSLAPSFCGTPGQGGACVLTPDGGFECVHDFVACTATDVGTCVDPAGGADTDYFVLDCESEPEPFVADCGAFGGSCTADGCGGIDAGNVCDDDLFVCDNGLDCAIPAGDEVGTCMGAAGDAGDMGGDVGGDLGGDLGGDVSADTGTD